MAGEPTHRFNEIDLSRWGIAASSKGAADARLHGRISDRHHQILKAVARRQRMTNRAALARIVELFVESGEFAKLMNRRGFQRSCVRPVCAVDGY